jgi:hypothetical protein
MKIDKPNLSLALIAKNEEGVIGRCLESVRGVADELIVVDTGSSDTTKALAASAGATVLDFVWTHDFSAARNAALDAARGRWILVLDADEYLPPTSAEAVRTLVTNPAPPDCAYHLLNKSSTDGGKTGLVGKIVRLFPNLPALRYEWPVHEQVVTSLERAGIPVRDTEIEIIHTGYATAEINARKQARNLAIFEAQAASGTMTAMMYFLMGGALLDLGRTDEALAIYERSAALCPGGGEVFEGARVRRATCLVQLGRFAEALALAPAQPLRQWHPELLLLLGEAALITGEVGCGLERLEAVLGSAFRPLIPAYDSAKVKIRAVMAIASWLEKRDSRRAVALLRLATESFRKGQPPSAGEVLALLR